MTQSMEIPANVGRRPFRKRADDYFFAAMTLLIVATVFVGFARTYFMAGIFQAKLPSPLVHVHGALFSCWILLFAAQVAAVSAGRVSWHKRLGVLGMLLAASMVMVGFATLVGAERRHFAPVQIFVYDAMSLSLFGGLVLWAYLVRRDAVAHKRLIFLATVAILAPALSRWPYAFLDSDVVFFSMLDSFLVFLMIFDLWSWRKLQVVTVCGTLLIVTLQLAYRPIAKTGFVHRVTTWIQSS